MFPPVIRICCCSVSHEDTLQAETNVSQIEPYCLLYSILCTLQQADYYQLVIYIEDKFQCHQNYHLLVSLLYLRFS